MRRVLTLLVALSMLFALAGCGRTDEDPSGLDVDRLTRAATANPEDSGDCGDNLKWYYKDGVIVITGDGEMTVFDEDDSTSFPWYEHTADIEAVVINEGCVFVSKHAFDGCAKLTRIHLPDSMERLGLYAFANCAIESVFIPKSMEESGDMISLAFLNNPIQEFTVDSDNQYYAAVDGVLYNRRMRDLICYPWASERVSFVIPEKIQRVVGFAFDGCTNLRQITIPESMMEITNRAFYGCDSLTTIDIPDNITLISAYAFYGCINLYSVTIPDSVTRIERYAFGACYVLHSIEIPDSVEIIENDVFTDTPLTRLTYNGTAEGYPWGADI